MNSVIYSYSVIYLGIHIYNIVDLQYFSIVSIKKIKAEYLGAKAAL